MKSTPNQSETTRSKPIAWTWALATIAVVASGLATAGPNDSLVVLTIWSIGYVAAAALIRFSILPKAQRELLSRAGISPIILLGLFAIPIAGAMFLPLLKGFTPPMELGLLRACRNLCLGLTALSVNQRNSQFSALCGLFIILFVGTMGDNPYFLMFLTAFTGCGVIWLMESHQQEFGPVEGRRAVVTPRSLFAAAMLVGVVAGIAAFFSPVALVRGITGFMPASGGIGDGSPDARNGIGNGPDMIASQHPKSSGYDNSNMFANSDHAGLYNAFIQHYNSPVDPKVIAQKHFQLHRQDIQYIDQELADDLRRKAIRIIPPAR